MCRRRRLADRDAAFRSEVERLHALFENWFCGVSATELGTFEASLDPAFVIVGPNGVVHNRRSTIEMVERGHNSGEVRIWIESARIVADGSVTVGTYEEHQERGGIRTARLSTVVMRHTDSGWRWLAVHETWLAPVDT